MRYTKHALQRMAERNITKPIVLGVMINSLPVKQEDETKRHSLSGINVVIVDSLDGEEIVVTVFEDKFYSRKRRYKKVA